MSVLFDRPNRPRVQGSLLTILFVRLFNGHQVINMNLFDCGDHGVEHRERSGNMHTPELRSGVLPDALDVCIDMGILVESVHILSCYSSTLVWQRTEIFLYTAMYFYLQYMTFPLAVKIIKVDEVAAIFNFIGILYESETSCLGHKPLQHGVI